MEEKWGIEELSNYLDLSITDSNFLATIKLQLNNELKKTLSVDNLLHFLKANNVIFGIDHEMLRKICDNPKNYYGKETVIARGKRPKDGEDGYIEWAIKDDKDVKPKQMEDGRVDFYSTNKVINISKGQLITTKLPSSEGENGFTVQGMEMKAKKGKEKILKQGKNVVFNDAKDKLYATIDGQLVITDQDRINIFPIYEVTGDVDLSIGNIDFVGTVVIRGNVPDGFKIKADGDIKIHGNVEGAELIAEGSIFIQHGVIGHNKSLIRTQQDFKASFVLDADIYAYENVTVTQSIMHSNISAGKNVICEGLKGIIVGGRIQAGAEVIATVIGNSLATPTSIEVGINPEIRSEYIRLIREKANLEDSFDKVSKGLNLLDRLQKAGQGLSAEKKMVQVNLINQQLVLEKSIKAIKANEKELEEKLSSFDHAGITVKKVIYPGVKLVIGKCIKLVKNDTKFTKFVLDKGVIINQSI